MNVKCACLTVFAVLSFSAQPVPALADPIESQSTAKQKVTRGEFYAALGRIQTAADKVLGLPVRSSGKPSEPDKAVTRKDVVIALHAQFAHFKPKFRVAPRPLPVVDKAMDRPENKSFRAELETLVKWGFVGSVGPLVTGPGEDLNAEHIGDAIGYFYNQLTVLTHQADPKWTPRLQRTDGG